VQAADNNNPQGVRCMSRPEIGTLVLDMRSDRIGRVMDAAGDRVFLRPPRGGREWQCPAAATRPADLSALVSVDAANEDLTS
jgi:hypothetical protein